MAKSGRGKNPRTDTPLNIPDKIKRLYPRNGASDWIGEQEDDPQPICYLSGTSIAKDWSEKDFIDIGAKWRCFSYAYGGFGSPMYSNKYAQDMQYSLNKGSRAFLDSGAHSFHKMRDFGSHSAGRAHEGGAKADQLIEQFAEHFAKYVRWCYTQGIKFDFYVTFDAKRECPFIFDITRSLRVDHGIYSVPVYHGDQSSDWVKKYADRGHKLIGIGISRVGKHDRQGVRRYYDTVLTLTDKLGMRCHGFAVTGDLMFEYPWYSCDSTTWAKAAINGKILDIRPEKQRVALIHVSTRFSEKTGYGKVEALSPETYKYVRGQVEGRGFDFDRVRSNLTYRAMYNGKLLLEAVNRNKPVRSMKQTWQSVI